MDKSLEMWKGLLKLKLGHFSDDNGELCWTFYKKDLEKLIKPTPLTKRQKKQNDQMWDSLTKDLKKIWSKKLALSEDSNGI